MAQLDPNIILSGSKPVNALQLLQAQAAGQQLQHQQLQMDEQMNAIKERNALASLYADQSNRDPEGGLSRNAMTRAYGIAPTLAPALEKAQLEMERVRSQIKRDKMLSAVDALKLTDAERGALFDFVAANKASIDRMREAGKTPEQISAEFQPEYTRRIEALGSSGRVGPKALQSLSMKVDVPGTDLSYEAMLTGKMLEERAKFAREQAAKPPPAPHQIFVGNDQVQQEFYDPKTGTTSRGPVVQRFPPGPVIQVEGGFARVAPNNTTAPVTVGTGPQAQPPVNAATRQALSQNRASLTQAEAAIAAVQAHPEAFGMRNLLPDEVMQRINPEGVEARARVSDIGSLKIHERSGAAVTAAETPRLKPFIPTVRDTPEAATKKLSLFIENYRRMNDELEAGRSLVDVIKSPAATSTRSEKVPVKTVEEALKLPSGTVVVLPDGREKVVP